MFLLFTIAHVIEEIQRNNCGDFHILLEIIIMIIIV